MPRITRIEAALIVLNDDRFIRHRATSSDKAKKSLSYYINTNKGYIEGILGVTFPAK